MESLFFNITDTRYKVTEIVHTEASVFRRVDISNGVLFFEGKLVAHEERIRLENIDAFVMVVLVRQGSCQIEDHLGGYSATTQEGRVSIFCSSRQDMTLTVPASVCAEVFVLFVSDFFLKRYLSGKKEEPIDFLYRMLREEITLRPVDNKPVDALSLYLVEKIIAVEKCPVMKSLRAQELLIEFMIHRFGLLDIVPETISEEERKLAQRARAMLLENFVNPPAIETMAHRCATNSSKLKKVFKKVYQTTIHGYVQKLRLEEANMLLKERRLSIGEVAKRVGYRHQGYFSKLFFETYGVYPKELTQNFR